MNGGYPRYGAKKNMASLFSSMYICLQKLYTHIMIFCACSVYTIHILPTRVPVLDCTEVMASQLIGRKHPSGTRRQLSRAWTMRSALAMDIKCSSVAA